MIVLVNDRSIYCVGKYIIYFIMYWLCILLYMYQELGIVIYFFYFIRYNLGKQFVFEKWFVRIIKCLKICGRGDYNVKKYYFIMLVLNVEIKVIININIYNKQKFFVFLFFWSKKVFERDINV